MKKVTLLLAVAALFTTVACGGGEENQEVTLEQTLNIQQQVDSLELEIEAINKAETELNEVLTDLDNI